MRYQKIARQNWFRDAAALLILAGAVFLFFWPVILGQGWIPRGGGDSVSFLYPMYRFAAQSFHSGTIPLWNPYQYAGAPFISDNQAGIFYPFNLLLFLANPEFSYRAIEGLILWHFFFAGAAMYICLRMLQSSRPLWRPAAITGSLAFMFCGVFIAHIGNLNLIAVSAWLPLAFLALHRAIDAQKSPQQWLWTLTGGLFLGISTLAGHGQMTFLLAAFLGVYALYCSVSERRLQPLIYLAILGLTAVTLAAINIIPTITAVQHTVRSGFETSATLNYALPWRGLLGLFAPNFFGLGEVYFWGDWPRVEYGYVGILTLFLAGLAIFIRPSRQTWFFTLAGAVFLLLALGPNTPLYPLLVRLLPWFPFQVPARFILLLDFCLAVLAALGMDAFRRRQQPLKTYFIVSAALTTIIGAIFLWQYNKNIGQVPHHQQQMITAVAVFTLLAFGSWSLILAASKRWLPMKVFGFLAILLLGLDLILLGWWVEVDWNDPQPGFAAGSAALEVIKADAGIQRIDIATGAWQPNLPQLEGLYSIEGVYNPLELANYAAYIGSVGYRGSTLYNLLGTKYVIGGKKEPPGDTNFLVPIFEDDPQVTIYLNTLALPRVMMVYNAVVAADHDQAFTAVHESAFNPLETVILESGSSLQQPPGQANITIRRYDPNHVLFEVKTDKPGYFLLSDIYHPDWRATVDGQEAPILVADYALRAVYLNPGTHLVEMVFSPAAWRWGLGLTLLAWISILLLFAGLIWRNRRKKLDGHA